MDMVDSTGLPRLSQVRGKTEDSAEGVVDLRRGRTGGFDEEIGQTARRSRPARSGFARPSGRQAWKSWFKDFFSGLRSGLKNFSALLADAVNLILLLLIYIFAVGLTSIFAKMVGKKFMNTKAPKVSPQTYWVDVDASLYENPNNFYRQF